MSLRIIVAFVKTLQNYYKFLTYANYFALFCNFSTILIVFYYFGGWRGGNKITRCKKTPARLFKGESECNVGYDSEEEKEESYGAGAVEPRDKAPFPPFGHPYPQGARDCNADGIYPGDGDSVGAITEVPSVAVGGVPTVDIDCVGNAIPSGGGHLEGIAARRDGIPLGRRHNAFGKTDRHTVVDVLADGIRLGINAKVRAVASVGGGHDHVLGAAGEHRQGGSQEKELRR